MNSEMSLEHYRKITILLEILAESQYLPPSHTQKPSVPKGLIIQVLLSTQLRKQTMNLSFIVGFVICLTGTTSMAMMMILLLLILMKGIPLVMIQIEVILQMAPQMIQKQLQKSRITFCISGYYSEQYPHCKS